jgi:hypothetical protein
VAGGVGGISAYARLRANGARAHQAKAWRGERARQSCSTTTAFFVWPCPYGLLCGSARHGGAPGDEPPGSGAKPYGLRSRLTAKFVYDRAGGGGGSAPGEMGTAGTF